MRRGPAMVPATWRVSVTLSLQATRGGAVTADTADPGTDTDSASPVDISVVDTGSAPEDTGVAQDTGAGAYHPAGWSKAENHAPAVLLGEQDCRSCHGDDLAGGTSGVGCDDCHSDGWRTNCTFCHGGVDNDTGAPPLGLHGQGAQLVYPPHTKHVEESTHPAFACTQCHVQPTDVLSIGHVFDDTAGKAEVTFAGGLNAAGSYSAGTCSSMYCHGNGRGDNGTAQKDAAPMACSSCHPDKSSGSSAFSKMSGRHSKHLNEGVSCWECHQAVLAQDGSFVDPTLHVNGTPDVKMPAGITITGSKCSGKCHGKGHSYNW